MGVKTDGIASSNRSPTAYLGCILSAVPRGSPSKCSNEGCDYLSLKLDDPSFNVPIFVNLFDEGDVKASATVAV